MTFTADDSHDDTTIARGINTAAEHGRVIDDLTARVIAGQFHGGEGSALYSLASCGAVDAAGLHRELDLLVEPNAADHGIPVRWVCALRDYINKATDR
ncbi:hypothetical protein [Fodinicola feengrottensis]|nr:hypothetical protein [Fodinicola feengrottensis]